MSRLATYAVLANIGPVVTTGEAGAALHMSLSATSRALSRLADEGQAQCIRHGLWNIGAQRPDPFSIVSDITRPYPSYVSFVSALDHHGIIDQLPRDIFVASLDRARQVPTSVGTYVVHHLPPPLFDGWTLTPRGPIATPEKAIFDICYISAAHAGVPRHIPELDLPRDFDAGRFEVWLERIQGARARTLTRRGLDYALGRAVA